MTNTTTTTKTNWLDRSLVNGPYLCLCLTEDDLKAVCKHLKVELEWPTSAGSCYELESGDKLACVVTINNVVGRYLEEIVGLLAHEATHAKQYAMKFIGEKSPSSEFEAYTMQNITQNLLEELLRRVELNKKLIVTKLRH